MKPSISHGFSMTAEPRHGSGVAAWGHLGRLRPGPRGLAPAVVRRGGRERGAKEGKVVLERGSWGHFGWG